MARSQFHGTAFENLLRPGFPGSIEHPQASNAVFDFPAEHDLVGNLPTSVKTTGDGTVCLADARRTFACEEPFRLLVGIYVQDGAIKRVEAVHEFEVTAEEWRQLKGDLSLETVRTFHETLLAFGPGDHVAARTWAKARKQDLMATHPRSVVQINPKIDSKRQRRLQASIPLAALVAGVARHTCHTQDYRGLALPVALKSGRRERQTKAPEGVTLSPENQTIKECGDAGQAAETPRGPE